MTYSPEVQAQLDQILKAKTLISEHKTHQALLVLQELLPPYQMKSLIDAWLNNDDAVDQKKATKLQQENLYAVLANQARTLADALKDGLTEPNTFSFPPSQE